MPDGTASLILTFNLLHFASEGTMWEIIADFPLTAHLKSNSFPVLCLCFPLCEHRLLSKLGSDALVKKFFFFLNNLTKEAPVLPL